MEAALKAQVPIIEGMIAAVSNDKLRIRAVADEITTLCLNAGLAYQDYTNVGNIAAHPDNRYKIGVDPHDCQQLLSEIVQDGWSWSGLGTCKAFEKRSGQKGLEQ